MEVCTGESYHKCLTIYSNCESCALETRVRTCSLCEKEEYFYLGDNDVHRNCINANGTSNLAIHRESCVNFLSLGLKPKQIVSRLVTEYRNNPEMLRTIPRKEQISDLGTRFVTILLFRERKKFKVASNWVDDAIKSLNSWTLQVVPSDLVENRPVIFTPSITDEDINCMIFTKASIRTVVSAQEVGAILHMDCTFKLSEHGYKGFVIGYTDYFRKLHPIAIGTLSHMKKENYITALNTVKSFFAQFNVMLNPSIIMVDGEEAQNNAIASVFPEAKINTCYFHVCSNIKKRLKKDGIVGEMYSTIMQYVDTIHMSRDESQRFDNTLDLVIYLQENNQDQLVEYLEKEWLRGTRSRWCIFHSKSGFPKTNNPVEIVNKDLKETYFKREKLKLVPMLHNLASYLEVFYSVANPFRTDCFPHTDEAFRLAKKLVSQYSILKANNTYHLQSNDNESESVNETEKSCSCQFFMKFASCHHIIIVSLRYNLNWPGIKRRQRLGYLSRSTGALIGRNTPVGRRSLSRLALSE